MGLLTQIKDMAFPPPEVFQADLSLANDLPQLPKVGFSYDAPYSGKIGRKREGYHSLGIVPNFKQLRKKPIRCSQEIYTIKDMGSFEFSVPASCGLLIPAIKLAAAFEAKNGVNFEQKKCVIIVRDNTYFDNEPAQELHRDPPELQHGRRQNVYSFASNHATKFPGFRTPQAFEMICFTAASLHRRPAISLVHKDRPLRRLFVAIAFDLKPEPKIVPSSIPKVGAVPCANDK